MTTVEQRPSVTDRAVAWGRQPDISARSALVTIFGDTVAPLGGTLWLADLIALAEPFGFSERLVRTSMFRLVSEGWVDNERIGRRSRYSLTGYGLDEIASAEDRIYRRQARTWDGQWTLVFVTPAATPDADSGGDQELIRHLRWRGFAQLAEGVHATPNDGVDATRRLFDRLGLDPHPPLAAARFDDEGPVAGSGPFRIDSGLAAAEDAYRRFVERYRWVEEGQDDALTPLGAFALRTMVVHDLRRARLRDPQLPPELLPDDWVGGRAVDLAGAVYRTVSDRAWAFVADVTGLHVDTAATPLPLRFAPAT